jgi:prevent-host-death family protein
MTISTISSRQFNQDASKAKTAAKKGPVFITDRGRPAHVLLTIEAYHRLAGCAGSIIDQLALPTVEEIEFDAPRANVRTRPAEFP